MKLRLTLENTSDLPATAPASIEFGDRESLSIGRAQGLDWTLPDPSQLMSGRHCEIRRSPEAYLLYDLSTNGTFIDASNARLTSPHALQDGERLLIGAYLIRVEVTDDGEGHVGDGGCGRAGAGGAGGRERACGRGRLVGSAPVQA